MAASARFPAFGAVADSRTVGAPTMLRGVLTEPSGRPVVGATVLLAAWPSNESLRALPVGSTFPITPVAKTVTDAQGRYELRAALTPLLRGLLGADGLDVELDVFHGGRHHVHLTQVDYDATVGGWVRDLTGAALEPAGRGAHGPSSFNLAVDPTRGAVIPPAVAAANRAQVPADHVSWPECSDYRKLPPKVAPLTVATAMASNGVTIRTTYTNKASTSVGTGVSYNGGVAFSQEGSRSRSSRFTAHFFDRKAKRGRTIHREYRVEWRHHIQDRHCQLQINGPYQVQVITSPDIATGGGGDRRSRYRPWSCPPLRDNTRTVRAEFKKISTENVRARSYASGFSINPVGRGGFAGTTRSGYSNAVEVTFLFNNANGGLWCGDTDVPAAPHQRVRAFRR